MGKQANGLHGLDDLPAMAIFARVVESRSYTRAARALQTSTSAVSKRVARLEQRLGVRLLQRSTRRIAPTEAGVAFYEHCARILADVRDAEHAVSRFGDGARGLLRVTAPVSIGEYHLAPLMAAFLAKYPEIRVDLSLTDRVVGLVEEGYDAAVHIGALADSSLVARRVATIDSVVCGSPDYFARRGVPHEPDELVVHDCIHFAQVPLAREWSFRTREGMRSIPVTPRLQLNSATALREAAIAGAGIIHVLRLEVTRALRDGALQTVLDEYTDREVNVTIVHPGGTQPTPKLRGFVEFMTRELPRRLRFIAS